MNYENYDPSFPDQPVVDLYLPIWAHLPAFRHKPAFIWAEDGPARSPSSFLTYDQLNTSVRSISSNLSLTLQKGDTVAILCGPGLDLVAMIFACQRAGLRAVPVTPPHLSSSNNHHHHLIRVLSQTKPRAAIAPRGYIASAGEYSSGTGGRLPRLLKNLRWLATEDLTAEDDNNNKRHERAPGGYEGCRADDVYLIQYTSGATGIPKPVMVTAGAAAHNVRVARRSYDLHPNSTIVSWLPQYHDCGLMFLLLTVVSGATCVLASPAAFLARPRMWLEMITEHRATCTPIPSFALPLVLRRGGADKGSSHVDLRTMKNLIIINEPIEKAPIDEFVRVFSPLGLHPSSISPSYGLAENCTFVSTAWRSGGGGFPVHKKLLPSAKLPTSREEMLAEDIEILVVNEETHEAVDDGVEGEIWISSPGTALGYLDHPSLTREVFNGRLSGRVAGCYVRTGDRGVVAGHERFLYVMGRCADMIKNVDTHPHYIEAAAHRSCPGQLRAGCLAAFEHRGAVAVVAELVRPEEMESDRLVRICEGIREAVWDAERVEVGVVALARSRSVAKTTSGKIQRWAAKYSFERDELKEVVRVRFGEDGCLSTVFGHGHKERERQGILLAAAATDLENPLSLQSSL